MQNFNHNIDDNFMINLGVTKILMTLHHAMNLNLQTIPVTSNRA